MKTGQTKVINYDKLTYAGNLDTLVSIEGNPLYKFEQGDICDANRLKNLSSGPKTIDGLNIIEFSKFLRI